MTKPARARSRLKQTPSKKIKADLVRQRRQLAENTKDLRQGVSSRVKYFPLLLIATAFYTGLYVLMNNIRPAQIRDWPLPNTFLPFHLLLFFANFFLLTFLTLRKRWALLFAFMIQWLLFLKLQSFTLDLWAWGSALLIGLAAYGLRVMWNKGRGYNA